MGAKLLAEFIGTFWLVLGGCGSAVLAAAFPGVGIGLLGVSFAFGLTVLTGAYALGPISGGHFNPAVSIVFLLRGRLTLPVAAAYLGAQLVGCCVGALMAHAMFELPIIQAATHGRAGIGQLLSEMVATAGLIISAVSSTSAKEAAWRVPAWIGAAYWFTASTSFKSCHHGSSRSVRHSRRDTARGCPRVHRGADAGSAGRARSSSVAVRLRRA